MNQPKPARLNPAEVAAIFFDFGDTLAMLNPSREELFARAARTVGLELDATTIKRAYETVDFHHKYSSLHVKDRGSFYQKYNEHLAAALGISSYMPELGTALAAQFTNSKRWQLFPEVPTVLARLAQFGLRLALVANWDANLESLTEELGIKKSFEKIFPSACAGVEKPDPEIFLAAASALSLRPATHKIIYVGNEYGADVVGPRAAGLIPVLIDRTNSLPHADCLRFSSLTACLTALLEQK